MEFARDLTEQDLVFTCVANGVSSLLTLPAPGLSLEDLRRTTLVTQIERGMSTRELNPIRNHLDRMKGGRISRYFHPARMIHIIAIDPGDLRAADAPELLASHPPGRHDFSGGPRKPEAL